MWPIVTLLFSVDVLTGSVHEEKQETNQAISKNNVCKCTQMVHRKGHLSI